MARRWRAFDPETINRELAALAREDLRALRFAMFHYGAESGAHCRVENYGKGLMMVTNSGRGQGRCLFFTVRIEDGVESLTALLVYKKESQKAPQAILDTARRRMREGT